MLAWLRGSDHRMSTGVGVFAGVLIRGAVAAQRNSTCLARPQMNPVAADLNAFFAFATMRLLDRLNRDRIQMRTASIGHYSGQSISRYEDVQSACRPFQS
jgi:hypothetical protein